ncbi:MAG: hypothetical protein WC977_07305 [Anaerovoracaceae bacterium]
MSIADAIRFLAQLFGNTVSTHAMAFALGVAATIWCERCYSARARADRQQALDALTRIMARAAAPAPAASARAAYLVDANIVNAYCEKRHKHSPKKKKACDKLLDATMTAIADGRTNDALVAASGLFQLL